MGKPLDDMFEKEAVSDAPTSPFKPAYGGGGLGELVSHGLTRGVAGPTAGAMLGPQLDKVLSPRSDEKIEREALQEVFDPSHEAEMQKIKTQAMLTEFMSTDPIISTFEPEEISSAYNHISQLAPRAALQPSLMRGLLRKMLQQQDTMEAFDVEQLTKIEQNLKKLETPERTPAVSGRLWNSPLTER